MHLTLRAGLLLLVLLSPLGGHAQESVGLQSEEKLLLQDIPSVYGASKYEQKVTEAPSSVSIVTADEIKKFGYRTLADILRSVRGFYVTYDRNYSYVGVRGFGRTGDYNSRILIVVDGHRLNENVYDSVYVGTDGLIDVDLIERVEVIRGPSSSLYGSNAFFAVINIITKRGRDVQGAELSGEAGSYDTYKGRLSYGSKLPYGFEGLLSGAYYTSSGQRLFFPELNDPATNNGVAAHSDYDRYYNLFGKLSWRDFTLEGAYLSRKKGIPTGAFGTALNDSRNHTVDNPVYIDLQYDHVFTTEWRVLGRLHYDRYYYYGDYILDIPERTLNKDSFLGEWWGGESQVITKVLPWQTVTLGAEFRVNTRQELLNFNETPFVSNLDVHRRSTNWGLYVQDEVTFGPHLTLNAGARYDYYDSFGSTVNPRLALIYNPWTETTLKVLYGTAFRAPNLYERFFQDGHLFLPNPDLQPETITTYELILEQYLGAHLRGTAVAFYYDIDKLITPKQNPVGDTITFQNAGNISAYGMELEMEGHWASGWTGRLSYTYQAAEDRLTHSRLINSPRHLVKGNLIAPLWADRLFAGVEMQYTSRRKTLAGKQTSDAFLTNVTLFSHNLLKGLEVSASIYNLFDVSYGDPAGEEHRQDIIPQDGRSFRLKITYGF